MEMKEIAISELMAIKKIRKYIVAINPQIKIDNSNNGNVIYFHFLTIASQ